MFSQKVPTAFPRKRLAGQGAEAFQVMFTKSLPNRARLDSFLPGWVLICTPPTPAPAPARRAAHFYMVPHPFADAGRIQASHLDPTFKH